MKKIDLGQTITILANAGVIASIVFLGFELHQNTMTMRGTTIQAIASQSVDFNKLIIENADLRAARRAARDGDLTEDQQMQLRSYYGAAVKIQLNRFQQVKVGILDAESIFDMGGRGLLWRDAYFADVWSETKQTYPVDFQHFMEEEILPMSTSTE